MRAASQSPAHDAPGRRGQSCFPLCLNGLGDPGGTGGRNGHSRDAAPSWRGARATAPALVPRRYRRAGSGGRGRDDGAAPPDQAPASGAYVPKPQTLPSRSRAM